MSEEELIGMGEGGGTSDSQGKAEKKFLNSSVTPTFSIIEGV